VLALTLVALAGLTAAGVAVLGGGSGSDTGEKKVAKKAASGGEGSQTAAGEETASAPGVEGQGTSPSAEGASLSANGASLNALGFELINQGRAAEAVPILRRAVDSFPEGTTDLNYAYALYNLGNALRLSGRPGEAIPILERRLQIPNQRSTVAAELARARAEAGAD
jgi:tetratricopeptide (TPR) repeat protein